MAGAPVERRRYEVGIGLWRMGYPKRLRTFEPPGPPSWVICRGVLNVPGGGRVCTSDLKRRPQQRRPRQLAWWVIKLGDYVDIDDSGYCYPTSWMVLGLYPTLDIIIVGRGEEIKSRSYSQVHAQHPDS